MSTKNYLRLWLAALSLLTMAALLYSIRDRLPSVATYVLIVVAALLLGYVMYLGHKFYVRLKQRGLELAKQREELEQDKQNRRIAQERWEVERQALLLAQQIQVSRIYPDNKGYMPMLVNITEAGHQYVNLPHPAHQGRISGAGQQPALPEHAESLAGLPTTIRYEQIAAQIPRGHGLLGCSATSVETAEFTDFMTMLISGGSHSGKSNTVGLKISEAIAAHPGIQLIVIDWHTNKPDSLYNKIRCYEDHFMMPVCRNEEETMPALDWFLDEFNRRVDAGRGDRVVLLVIDEIPGMLRRGSKELVKKLKDIAETCGEESRGFGMFGWFIAQRMIGLAWLRNVVHTVIAHKAGRLNEAVEACNGHKDIARSMELWPIGRVIVYGQNFEGVKVLQMPTFTMPTVDADPGSGAVYVEGEEDEMEGLQPKRRDVLGRSGTTRYVEAQTEILDGQDDQLNALSGDSDEEMPFPANVRTFPGVAAGRLVDTSDEASEDRPKEYRFTEAEIPQFLAAWRASGSIDKACQALRKSAPRYRQHAKEILAAHNARHA